MLSSMKQYRGAGGFALLLGAMSSFAVGACGEEFGSCMETHTCPVVADGGEPASGAPAQPPVAAGNGADASGGAVSEGSGGAESQGGMTAAPGAAGHVSIDDGGAPSVTPPDTGEPCSDSGALRCVSAAQKVSQICEAGYWETALICKAGENCHQATGACAPILAECQDKIGGQLYCGAGDKVFGCGPDLVSTEEVETCEGSCIDAETSASCAPVTCGDGKLQAPEECDDGNKDQTDGCTNACKDATCGDGSMWKDHEACDDGNTKNDDACSATCKVSTCGDGYVWIGKETCDDKNKVDTDACTNACKKAACGDGIIQAGKEECDDKNATSGDGCSKTCTVEPVQIVGMESTICALGSNGQIRCVAAGTDAWTYTSVMLGAGEKATALSAGWLHICAVLENGALRCWGDNRVGQLGLGDTKNRSLTSASTDVDLGPGAIAKAVAASALYTCAVMADGKAKCWGNSTNGVLGVPSASPVGDEAGEMGSSLKAVAQPDARPFARVAAGDAFACGIRVDKTAYCWGAAAIRGAVTPESNLSLGTPLTVDEISVGGGHACAILTNGAAKCWGANDEGQLGQGDKDPRSGPSEMGDALSPVQLGVGTTAKSVATGPAWSCAIVNDGSVKCWGRNAVGELGKGDKVSVGGSAGDMNKLQPLDLAERKARQVAIAGDVTTCALLEDGRVTCWGTVNTPSKAYLGDRPNEMGDRLPIVTLKF